MLLFCLLKFCVDWFRSRPHLSLSKSFILLMKPVCGFADRRLKTKCRYWESSEVKYRLPLMSSSPSYGKTRSNASRVWLPAPKNKRSRNCSLCWNTVSDTSTPLGVEGLRLLYWMWRRHYPQNESLGKGLRPTPKCSRAHLHSIVGTLLLGCGGDRLFFSLFERD